MKMVSIHCSGCPLEQFKFAGILASFEHSNFTRFPTLVCSNWKSSIPRNYRTLNWGCRILFRDKGCRQLQLPRVRNSVTEFEALDDDDDELLDEGVLNGPQRRFREQGEEIDYDRDPEFGEILGSCLDDPDKAQSRMEERLRKKRHRVLQTKTGSGTPMKVTFNKFEFSNSYIWFEFYNPPLEKDVALICDMIRSWHIIGRLGGCNSLNMQLSQSPFDKRPSYDAIQGANVEPATFYNIGDFEIQDNLARIWVDIGTSEPLLLDVLLNALAQISSDFVGIKEVVFGGSEFENWKDNLTVEDPGFSVHKI